MYNCIQKISNYFQEDNMTCTSNPIHIIEPDILDLSESQLSDIVAEELEENNEEEVAEIPYNIDELVDNIPPPSKLVRSTNMHELLPLMYGQETVRGTRGRHYNIITGMEEEYNIERPQGDVNNNLIEIPIETPNRVSIESGDIGRRYYHDCVGVSIDMSLY